MTPPSLRLVLREGTAQAHARVDAQVGSLGSWDAYLRYLLGMRSFLGQVARVLGDPEWQALLARLDDELRSHRVPSLAAPAGPSPRRDGPCRLGWGYVAAGASVGARVLQRQVAALPTLAPEHGGFLHAYSESGLWPAWLDRLDRARLSPDGTRACLAGALEAFGLAELYFERAREAQQP